MIWYDILLLIAYGGAIISLIAVVLSENRNPVKSLAWVTVLLMVPVFGVVLYLFFGRSLKNTRMITRRNRRRLRRHEYFKPVDINRIPMSTASRLQIKMAQTLSGAIFYPGNKVEIFTDGRSKFDALLNDLRNATSYIHLQYYIFKDDKIGTEVAETLIDKARSGVKVRVIYDHIGSLHTSGKFFKRMKEAGVEVYPFFRVTFPHFATRVNWRNHRKIVIVDGTIGYIGGMNIADRYIDGGKNFDLWRDTHARVRGPIVASLLHSFAVDWNFMGQPLIDDIADPMALYGKGDVGMQMLTSGPTSQWSDIEFIFQKAIATARKRIYIQTPYFLPTDSLLKTLQAAALSHVDVRVMIPLHSDSRMLTYASESYISECLRSGIKFYQYLPGMMHSKTILVDDEFSTIGSTNFDFRSFEHNFEANLFIYSRKVNERMAEIFRADIHSCRRIVPAEWRSRPLWRKAMQSLLRLLSPIL